MSTKRDRVAVVSGLDDILGSVIAGDRERAGRKVQEKSPSPEGASSVSQPLPFPIHQEPAPILSVIAKAEDTIKEEPIMTSVNVIPHYDIMTNKQTIAQTDNETLWQEAKQEYKPTYSQTSNETNKQAEKQTNNPAIHQNGRKNIAYSQRTQKDHALSHQNGQNGFFTSELDVMRFQEARKLAQSPTMTVTLRLPCELNLWLDEYVHRAWPEKVRKQELGH